jgi:molybdopterin-synthase adenylyltransferase
LRSALVVGAGGLGCPVLLALAPRIQMTVIDPDSVDVSNLHRQILYRSADVGRPKVHCAAERLASMFSSASVTAVAGRLDASNAIELISGHDVVIDGCDSFATKFLLNDACMEVGVPLVHGAAAGWTGQLMTVMRGRACFRCIFEAPPDADAVPSCQNAGIVGAVCGVIGGWMAAEALAVVEGQPRLVGTLQIFDAASGISRQLAPRRRQSCPAHSASEAVTW